MRRLFRLWIADQAGSNVLEYGLILGLVSLSIILGAAVLANRIDVVFAYIAGIFSSITQTL